MVGIVVLVAILALAYLHLKRRQRQKQMRESLMTKDTGPRGSKDV
jgi:preprotein translocase subunit YajC